MSVRSPKLPPKHAHHSCGLAEFQFYPTNHSVVRAEYKYPCIPYEDTGVDKVGFFSGFEPVDAILTQPPQYSIRINDTNPIFYYCSAPGACINYGMVGAINPNATQVLAVQKQYALNSTFMLQPGQPWPAESTPDPFSTGPPTPTSTSPTAAPTSTAPEPSHSGFSTGDIAGVAIGGAAVAIIAAALLYLCGRHSNRSNVQPHPQSAVYGPPASFTPSIKHLTMASNVASVTPSHPGSPYASPALPGYVPVNDPAASPMRPYYVPSDALAPVGNEHPDGRSPSPTQMMKGVGVPPYTSLANQSAAVAPSA